MVDDNGAILLIISFFAIGHMSALSKCIGNRHLVTLAGNYERLLAVSRKLFKNGLMKMLLKKSSLRGTKQSRIIQGKPVNGGALIIIICFFIGINELPSVGSLRAL